MSLHSYARIWVHITWGTLERRPMLFGGTAAKLSGYLQDYALARHWYMKTNFINQDHVHVLVDLPVDVALKDLVQLFKGSSSHWLNENNLTTGTFSWGRGYGAFSVSQSGLDQVTTYIQNQQEHHRHKSFAEELRTLVERYQLKWAAEQ